MVAVLQPLSPGKRKAPRQFQEFQDRWRVLTRAAEQAGPHRRGKERCDLRMMPPTVEERLQPDVAANATDTQLVSRRCATRTTLLGVSTHTHRGYARVRKCAT